MNFKPELLEKVLNGTKTQTRRIKKPGQELVIDRKNGDSVVCETRLGSRLVYRQWKQYAACPGRGKQQRGRICITWIENELASDISESDAHAEGFGSREEFFEAWDRINGKGKRDVSVWVLCFELERKF